MKDIIFAIFSKIMDVPINKINEHSSQDSISTWDSLKHMKLIDALENEFSIQFTYDEIIDMVSIKEIIAACQGGSHE